MRRGELLALRWSDVDLGAGYRTVRCTEALITKSGAERRIPLGPRAVAVLSALSQRPSKSGYVFESGGRLVDGHTCSDIVRRFADRAGVPALTPHVLRHSCITWLIERGGFRCPSCSGSLGTPTSRRRCDTAPSPATCTPSRFARPWGDVGVELGPVTEAELWLEEVLWRIFDATG